MHAFQSKNLNNSTFLYLIAPNIKGFHLFRTVNEGLQYITESSTDTDNVSIKWISPLKFNHYSHSCMHYSKLSILILIC